MTNKRDNLTGRLRHDDGIARAVRKWRLRGPLGAAALSLAFAAVGGCTHKVDVQPITVEPIHMTLDINIKVERELEDFFDFEDRAATGGTGATGEEEPDAEPQPVPPPQTPAGVPAPEQPIDTAEGATWEESSSNANELVVRNEEGGAL